MQRRYAGAAGETLTGIARGFNISRLRGDGLTNQSFGVSAQDCAQASLLVARKMIGRCVECRRTIGDQMGHHRCKGSSVISRHVGGEDDRTMDRDSGGDVWPSAVALGRSGAPMSDAGAVLVIFSMLAVGLTAIRSRTTNSVGRYRSQ